MTAQAMTLTNVYEEPVMSCGQDMYSRYKFKDYKFKITASSLRNLWVNSINGDLSFHSPLDAY